MFKCFYLILIISTLLACHPTNKLVDHKVKGETNVKMQKTLIKFEQSDGLVKILDMAKHQGKPIFLYLHTDWCTPCRFMEKEVFSLKETADFINGNFIPYKVNMEKENGPDLSLIFNAKIIPTLLFLDEKGRELNRNNGSIGNANLIQLGNEVLNNIK